jgi:hypothetical protein
MAKRESIYSKISRGCRFHRLFEHLRLDVLPVNILVLSEWPLHFGPSSLQTVHVRITRLGGSVPRARLEQLGGEMMRAH